jgi:hypothetical protein
MSMHDECTTASHEASVDKVIKRLEHLREEKKERKKSA